MIKNRRILKGTVAELCNSHAPLTLRSCLSQGTEPIPCFRMYIRSGLYIHIVLLYAGKHFVTVLYAGKEQSPIMMPIIACYNRGNFLADSILWHRLYAGLFSGPISCWLWRVRYQSKGHEFPSRMIPILRYFSKKMKTVLHLYSLFIFCQKGGSWSTTFEKKYIPS